MNLRGSERNVAEKADVMSAYMATMTTTRFRAAAAGLCVAAALAAAGGMQLSANRAPARLLGVTTEGSAVVIEATEPVAYAVSKPDPLTLFVDMRNVSVAEAANRVVRSGNVAAVALEQTSAVDGREVARVRVSLVRPVDHKVRSARNTIRVELSAAKSAPSASALPVVPRFGPSRAPAAAVNGPEVNGIVRLEPDDAPPAAPEPPITLEQAIANAASLAPTDQPAPDPFSALQLTAAPAPAPAAPAARRAAPQTRTAPSRASNAGQTAAAPAPKPAPAAQPAAQTQKPVPAPQPAAQTEKPAPAPQPAAQTQKPAPQAAAKPAAARPAAPTPAEAPAPRPTVTAQPRQNAAPAPAPVAQAPAPAAEIPVAPQQVLNQQPAPREPAPQAPAPRQAAPQQAPPASNTTQQQIAGANDKKYTGHPITMDFQGVDLRSVLRTFAEISGLNMVIDPDVQGTVDMILTDVPWDQALEVILRGNSLDYTVDGSIVRVAKIDTLKKEQESKQSLARASADAGTLAVRTFSLSYAKAAQAAPLVKRAVLSQRGDVQIDERTNTLIITDLPARLDTVAQLLATLDRAEPQVEVEARVVQTTREFAQAVGIQWGLNGRVAPEHGNTPPIAFPHTGSATAGVNHSDLGVGVANSAIGLALGSINGALNLDVALSALERSGKGRILSTPRLTTQNNIEAEVAQGVQIPIQTVANNTVTVSFKDAVLVLKVTPQITAAGTVIMRITIENATADFSRQVNGIPPIDTQRANTTVQVNDGATTIIGGIFVSQEQTSNQRTPVLHRVPLLGWLFKRDSQQDQSRELLIFITPRILKG